MKGFQSQMLKGGLNYSGWEAWKQVGCLECFKFKNMLLLYEKLEIN